MSSQADRPLCHLELELFVFGKTNRHWCVFIVFIQQESMANQHYVVSDHEKSMHLSMISNT